METPPATPEITRMSNRGILLEIPMINGRLLTADTEQDISRTDHYTNIMNSAISVASQPTARLPISPDELIIQQRGRRKRPVIFSPDIDVIKQSKQESSTERSSSPNKSSILRNLPRKRLMLSDPSESSTPEKYKTSSSNPKKLCTELVFELPEDNDVLLAMKALTTDQLIGLFGTITNNHPNIEKEIKSHFPVADLKPIEDHIYYLRRNIFKALPTSRLISKTDITSYHRVSIHLMEFKKYVIDQGRNLVESKQWSIVMKYVFMAWKHVRHTPIWDSPSHNAVRRQCFKSLLEFCMIALKHMEDTLEQRAREIYKEELKFLSYDFNEGMDMCLNLLNHGLTLT